MRCVPEKAAAKAKGQVRYFTGKPCKNGHVAERFTCNGKCVVCGRESANKKSQCQVYKARRSDYAKKYALSSSGRVNRRNYLRNKIYGVSPQHYAEIFTAQRGLCAVCDAALDDAQNTHIDHDHVTGRIRGLLCRECNLGIGHFKDSRELLGKAAAYLSPRSLITDHVPFEIGRARLAA